MSRLRVAHISDTHWDANGDWADLQNVHEALLVQIRDAKVNLVVHAGDFFDRASEPQERLALAHWLIKISNLGVPFVGVKGNHDAALDLALFDSLGGDIYIFERPEFFDVRVAPGQSVRMLCLPWFDKATVASSLAADQQGFARIATIGQAQTLLSSWGPLSDQAHTQGQPVILVGHVQVQGCALANGQVLMGQTVELSPADLRLSGADYIAVGHIHQHQAWAAVGAAPVVYSGSPSRHDHGEPEAKGWVLVEFDGPRLASWRFMPLPARELYHVEIDATQPEVLQALRDRSVLRFIDPEKARGARVRIRYKVAAEDLALVDDGLLRTAAELAGAFHVKLERQAVATNVARAVAVEVSQQQSLAEKVQAYLRHKGMEDRWERVAPRLAELEGA